MKGRGQRVKRRKKEGVRGGAGGGGGLWPATLPWAPVKGGWGGCIGREGASETAPAAVRQAVGGGCQSGWGRLLSVTKCH